MNLTLLHISHRHGDDHSLHPSTAEAEAAQAAYARDNWHDRADQDVVDQPDSLSDDEVVSAYFTDHPSEFANITTIDAPWLAPLVSPSIDANSITLAQRVLTLIDAFSAECEGTQQTDTGAAWELFRQLRDTAAVSLAG